MGDLIYLFPKTSTKRKALTRYCIAMLAGALGIGLTLHPQAPPAYNDAYYRYGIMVTNAQVADDPQGQMKQFLAASWNFLPEYNTGQTKHKERLAHYFNSKYGQLPTTVKLTIPPSADIRQICGNIQEQCAKLQAKLTEQLKQSQEALKVEKDHYAKLEKSCKEAQINLEGKLDELKRSQEQTVQKATEVTQQLQKLKNVQNSAQTASSKFSAIQQTLLASYINYKKLQKSKQATPQEIQNAETVLINAWHSSQQVSSELRNNLAEAAGILTSGSTSPEEQIPWQLKFTFGASKISEENIRATVIQLENIR